MKKQFLPLGSVVLLRGGSKRVMIAGRLQQREEDHRIFDYCACYYPEGILNPEELFLFNHEDIENVSFVGYQDQEEEALQAYIQKRCEELQL